MPFPQIKSVTALKNYTLHVEFFDGVKGGYDLHHLAGKGVFKSWGVNNNFYKVSINPESGAITWPGGLDIDTINVYCKIKGVSVDAYLMKEHHASY